ncbi:MAG: hypothetical protein AB8H86_04945 [Polyangiales bacterium]
MTTVTEAIKVVLDADAQRALAEGDLEGICANPEVASRFARQLAEAARRISPGRTWSPEDLRDVLEVAVHGNPQGSARVLEGRYFRKRLKEQTNLADRYGDEFSVVVISVSKDVHQGVYSSVLDAVTERLRRTDMVFLYRRRFAVVLPRLGVSTLSAMLERIKELVAVGAGTKSIERIAGGTYPSDRFKDARAILDWSEDQLRDQPMDD